MAERSALDMEKGSAAVEERGTERRGPGARGWGLAAGLVAGLALVCVSCYLLLPTSQPTQELERNARSIQPTNGLSPLLKQVGNNQKIAAHLLANPSKAHEIVWDDSAQGSMCSGLVLQGNSLLVRTPGLYFVYSQVVYSAKYRHQSIYLDHTISKLSEAYPKDITLLKSTKSVQPGWGLGEGEAGRSGGHRQRPNSWFKTSYQGAIFELEAGDRLSSRVNEDATRFVDRKPGNTFFGAFAV